MHSVPVIDDDRPAATASSRSSQPPRRIDVSDLDARALTEFVDSSVETDDVSLEHRGSRTFLVVGQ